MSYTLGVSTLICKGLTRIVKAKFSHPMSLGSAGFASASSSLPVYF